MNLNGKNFGATVILIMIIASSSVCPQNIPIQQPEWILKNGNPVHSMILTETNIIFGDEYGIESLGYIRNRVWRYPTDSPVTALKNHKGIYASTSDGSIIKLNDSGKLIWSRDIPGYIGYGNALDADEYRLLTGSMDGFIYMFDTNKTFQWKRLIGSYVTNVKILEDRLIAISDRQVYIVDFDGRVRRNLNISGYIRRAAIMKDRIIVGMDDLNLIGYDLNGSVIFNNNIGSPITAIKADENILIGTQDGEIILFSKEGKQSWRYEMNQSIVDVKNTETGIFASTKDEKIIQFTLGGSPKWMFKTEGRANIIKAYDLNVVSATNLGGIYFVKTSRKESIFSLGMIISIILILSAAIFMAAKALR